MVNDTEWCTITIAFAYYFQAIISLLLVYLIDFQKHYTNIINKEKTKEWGSHDGVIHYNYVP